MRHARSAAAMAAVFVALAADPVFAQDPPAPAPPPASAPQPPAAPAPAPPPAAPPTVTTLPGGGAVSSAKTILENAAAARELADFTAAVKAADLTDALSGPGPFTVFIPDTGAFDRLPKGELPGWMRPDGKRRLADVLSYHVVRGALGSGVLAEQVKVGKGEAALPTLQGGYLTVRGAGRNLTLTDVNGTRARARGEAMASNGVIYVIDAVLQP